MTQEEGEENPLEFSLDTMFEKAWAEMEEKIGIFLFQLGGNHVIKNGDYGTNNC